MESIIKLEGISKKFNDIPILTEINLEMPSHEVIVFSGPSGSGKSTLLNIIGLLDTPDEGTVTLFGKANPKPFSKEATALLRTKIGYLFQNFALVENKSVEYNLMLALENVKLKNKKEKVSEALKKVGLDGFKDKIVYQCSGGEQQRIALARILLKPCELVLCDEPTGSLDERNRDKIIELLMMLKDEGKTVVIVTHDSYLMTLADTHLVLESNDGEPGFSINKKSGSTSF